MPRGGQAVPRGGRYTSDRFLDLIRGWYWRKHVKLEYTGAVPVLVAH